MKNQTSNLFKTIISSSSSSSSKFIIDRNYQTKFKAKSFVTKKLCSQVKVQSPVSHQYHNSITTLNQDESDNHLTHLINNALQHRHLNPILFNKLASNCSRQPNQLINLILGSLILNDQIRFKQYMNQLDPIHYPVLYPKLFKICGIIGRGMGMMRRVIRIMQNHHHLIVHDYQLVSEQELTIKSNMIETMEAYIENLIRWSQIHRAWSYLNSFDFGPLINLQDQVHQIGDPFAKKIHQIKKPSHSSKIWKPNQSAYSSLISIYLILNRPDLALDLHFKLDLSSMDQPMALIICAREIISRKQKLQVFPSFKNLDQFKLPTSPGPITTSVLAKFIYQRDGLPGLIKFLSKQSRTNSSSNRLLLSAWLDILIASPGEKLLEPAELSTWIEMIHQEGLLGEPELEKYLRYTREWLELELNQKIQFINSSQDPSILPSVFIDPNDPRLGYYQLLKFFQIVYNLHSSSSIQSSSNDHDSNLHHHFKPSTTVTSELIRISSLTGTGSKKLTELIDKEVLENQTPIRSSHMIGLIWSKIVDRDLIGLDRLIDGEMKFKYKLVLTGLLTTVILAGLIAIRAPKPMIIMMSQKLIEQCPTNPSHLASSSLRKSMQTHGSDAQKDGSLESYLNLIQVAHAIGDLMMIKDLHELIVMKFGRERLVCGLDSEGSKRLEKEKPVWVGLDYFRLIFEVYNHFNQPLEAHNEVIESLRLSGHFNQEATGQPEKYRHGPFPEISSLESSPTTNNHQSHDNTKFLSSGVLANYLEFQSITKLFHPQDHHHNQGSDNNGLETKTATDFDKTNRSKKTHESLIHERKPEVADIFLKSLIKSKHQMEKKIQELNKLKKLFEESDSNDGTSKEYIGSGRRIKEKVDKEWQVMKKEEVEDRLQKLTKASDLNQLLVHSLTGDTLDPSNLLVRKDSKIEIHSKQNLNWRDRSWSDDLKIGLKLIKKLF